MECLARFYSFIERVLKTQIQKVSVGGEMPPPLILFFMGEDCIISEYTKDISKMSVDLGSLGFDNIKKGDK